MPKRNTGEIHKKKKFVMKSIVKRYPLISYYVFAFVLSGVILALLYTTGLAETLFFLGTFGSGLAAILLHFMYNSTLNVLSPLSDRVTFFTAGILALVAVVVVVIWGAKTLTRHKINIKEFNEPYEEVTNV